MKYLKMIPIGIAILLVFSVFLFSQNKTLVSKEVSSSPKSLDLGKHYWKKELSQLGLPENTFKVIQYSKGGNSCYKTKYYIEQLQQEGVAVVFVPIFDAFLDQYRNESSNFQYYMLDKKGATFANNLDEEIWLLDPEGRVVYQGSVDQLNASLIELYAINKKGKKARFHQLHQQLISENDQINRGGIWLYENALFVAKETVVDLVERFYPLSSIYLDGVGEYETINGCIKIKDQPLLSQLLALAGVRLTQDKDKQFVVDIDKNSLSNVTKVIDEKQAVFNGDNKMLSRTKIDLQNVEAMELFMALKYHYGIRLKDFKKVGQLFPKEQINLLVNHFDSPTSLLENLSIQGVNLKVIAESPLNIIKLEKL